MSLRIFGAGALALALLIAPGREGHAAGWPAVTGKCSCGVIGWGFHFADCGQRICTKTLCTKACQPAVRTSALQITDISAARRAAPARSRAARDTYESERPQRPGHDFRSMRSDSASLPPTDVSSARRVRKARPAPAAVAVGAMDRDGRYVAAPAPQTRQRAAVARHRTGGLIGEIVDAAIAGARAGIASQVVAHPVGCPRVAFCGCGVAVHVLGAPVRALWLAANWLRFPRAAPAAGMVAVHPGRHHVLAIERVLPGGLVLAYDPNSGHHLTRLHIRSITGWPVVNPRG